MMAKTSVKQGIFVSLILGLSAMLSSAGAAEKRSPEKAKLNPFQGRQKRADDFSFAVKPAVKKDGDKYVISFTTAAACDATVMVVDKDGKVVRHLGSGVLGKNAPWPFTQGSLAQKIEWDGTDDQGESVDVSGATVKVGLGLRPTLDKLLGWAPGNVQQLQGFAMDAKGRLVLLGGNFGHASGNFSPTMELFDAGGQYIRQLIPCSPLVPPEKSTLIRLGRDSEGKPVIRLGRSRFQYTACNPISMVEETQFQTPVVTPGGKFVFLSNAARKKPRYLIFVNIKDGSTPKGSKVKIGLGEGEAHMAVSPDDKWLYISAPFYRNRRRSRHVIYRTPLANPGKLAVFAGTSGKAGKDPKKLKFPLGLTCDGKGNLYVADWGNSRVQVFSPDGKLIRSISTPEPLGVAVNPKNNDLYVMYTRGKGRQVRLHLSRFSGGDAAKRKELLKGIKAQAQPLMILDASGKVPVIWLKTYSRALHRYEDRPEKFTRTSGNLCGGVSGWGGWNSESWHGEIVADPYRNQLYVRSGPWLRVISAKGRVIDRLGCGHRQRKRSDKPEISQIVVGPDRMLVMRLSNLGKFLTRYNPDTKKYIGFPGNSNQDKWKKRYPGISIPNSADPRGWADQIGVAPNGDIYVPSGGLIKSDYKALKEAGLAYPHKNRKRFQTPHSANLLKVFSRDGKLKCISALPGMMHTQGIRIGRNGEVYAVMPCRPVKGGGRGGTLIKFNSRFGTFPVGRIKGSWGPPAKGEITHVWYDHVANKKTRIENVLWDYNNVMPVKLSGCQCPHSLFSLDGFERIFLPAAHESAVDILDANGNTILRIGQYGNMDCRGKDSPVLDPETGELRPRRKDDPEDLKSPLAEPGITFMHPNYTTVDDNALYVNDLGNRRIVRALLEYESEEELALE